MDNFLTNKYFCLAVIIALVVVTYLYTQKSDTCKVEGMRNVDFSMLAPELTDKPWADTDELKYKRIGGKFDKLADETTKRNLAVRGYKPVDFLKSTGQVYDEYIKYESVEDQMKKEKYGSNENIPTGFDRDSRQMMYREEKRCKPCKCDVDSDDEDSESEEIEYKPRKSKRNRRKYRKN